LTIPFSQGFSKLTSGDRWIYLSSLLFAAAAAALLMSPTAYHRLHFRAREKEQLLFTSNRLAVVGLGFIALAISASVYVVTHVVFGGAVAPLVTGGVALLFAWLWYGLPLTRKLTKPQ
jgi:hypothetical protein